MCSSLFGLSLFLFFIIFIIYVPLCCTSDIMAFISSTQLSVLLSILYFLTVGLFYVHGSVHRDFILIRSNKMQQYGGIYLLQIYSACFGCPSHPSSGVHATVTAASGTGHSNSATAFLKRGLIRPRWTKAVALLL